MSNPRLRNHARERILKLLYEKPEHYLKAQFGKILHKHRKLDSSYARVTCLTYQGRYFSYLDAEYIGNPQVKEAHPSLISEMEKFVQEYDELNQERKMISRALVIFLNEIRHEKDIQALLGDTLYEKVRSLLKRYSVGEDQDDRMPIEQLCFTADKYQYYLDLIYERQVLNIVLNQFYETQSQIS